MKMKKTNDKMMKKTPTKKTTNEKK